MCPIFVGSVHNFGRSDNYMIHIVKKCLFPIDAYMVWCPIWYLVARCVEQNVMPSKSKYSDETWNKVNGIVAYLKKKERT